MTLVRRFGSFWYDFLVGDDWTIAVAVVVTVGGTAALATAVDWAWLVLPLAVAAVLVTSVARAATRRT
jgi:hypothetical protein